MGYPLLMCVHLVSLVSPVSHYLPSHPYISSSDFPLVYILLRLEVALLANQCKDTSIHYLTLNQPRTHKCVQTLRKSITIYIIL